jgi:hypothetical protein
MKLNEFNDLTLTDKAMATYEKGKIIGFKDQGVLYAMIYMIGNFFVEILYYSESNEIKNIVTFSA